MVTWHMANRPQKVGFVEGFCLNQYMTEPLNPKKPMGKMKVLSP